MRRSNPSHRVEVADYPDLSKTVRLLLHLFDRRGRGLPAPTAARSPPAGRRPTAKPSTHTTGLSQKGMDLYIKRDGEWVFAGIARPGLGADHKATLVEHMDGTEKECLLYLPLFDEVKTLENRRRRRRPHRSRTQSLPPPDRGDRFEHHPRYGTQPSGHGLSCTTPNVRRVSSSSIWRQRPVQDGTVLRPCSRSVEADAFLFDSFSNPSAQQIEERLEPFVATIRAAHPTTPLIFLQTEVRESRNFNDKIRKFGDDKRAASEAGGCTPAQTGQEHLFPQSGDAAGRRPRCDRRRRTSLPDLGHGRILE